MTKSQRAVRPSSNITQLERDYAHIIMDSRDGDGSGLMSSRKFTRHTFVFVDGSRLLVTEELDSDSIDVSYYWVDQSGNTILSFHSEPHDKDPRYQTATEPHHIHPPANLKRVELECILREAFEKEELHLVYQAQYRPYPQQPNSIDQQQTRKPIVGSIISLVHQLDISVVAEGVENEIQLHYLKEQQCDFIQGFYWGKPITEHDQIELLTELKTASSAQH
ncbi:toxin-antitoxin system TumE family protein [Paenibacillus xylaniclasticus]|uniref:toxin-antitoxin system TumE family protein n=1 Tax=Paenibacillus xylaniclasticus TaxID=588083 RepID=UPI000FD8BC90|nr:MULTISPECIES: DUF6516 family protein [Paenibacillus]GFN32976.1 hypothetical protein PCURB6_32360 [Paenibacillus curdlanolyticus]